MGALVVATWGLSRLGRGPALAWILALDVVLAAAACLAGAVILGISAGIHSDGLRRAALGMMAVALAMMLLPLAWLAAP